MTRYTLLEKYTTWVVTERPGVTTKIVITEIGADTVTGLACVGGFASSLSITVPLAAILYQIV